MIGENAGDRIIIRDLRVRCIIGVNPEERVRKQRISIDVVLYTDLSRAGAGDSLEDTVSYSDIARRIVDHAESSSYELIETLAEAIAGICLEPERVTKTEVLIKKPGGIKDAAFAGVQISRSRESR